MVYTTRALKFRRYLEGDFVYRANQRWRKVMPTLTQRIKDLFDYKG